jgi:restriction system protein
VKATIREEADRVLQERRSKINAEIRREEQKRRNTLHGLRELGGHQFEVVITQLFTAMGYQARKTRGSGDGGIDIYAERNGTLVVIQCKNHKSSVGPAPVRDLFGVLTSRKADKAFLICTSAFTDGARDFANGKPIELVDGNQLLSLINTYGIDS